MLDSCSFTEDPSVTVHSNPITYPPFAHSSATDYLNCVKLTEQVNILRSEVGYWKSCHAKAIEREVLLKQKVEELKAKVRLRERQLFGRKSEKGAKGQQCGTEQDKENSKKRKRGQQPGSKGHGRRRHENLPSEEEIWALSDDEQVCPRCGLPLEPQGWTEDSEIVEVEVRAHRRIIRRRRYRRTCSCPGVPQIITAPGPAKLIPKGGYGISFWVFILLGKFLYQRPLYRILTELRDNHGLDISPGTATGGMERLRPLFIPLYQEIVARNLSEERWHADETRWQVFAEMEEKETPRWYLWIFCSKTTVVFRMEPTRSSDVPKDHFGEEAKGILVVDRYSAYKVLLKQGRILLAFCWAHVRRDFLAIAKDWPSEEKWAFEWIENIRRLYALNDTRLNVLDVPGAFDKAHARLSEAIDNMAQERDAQLKDPKLHIACRKVLQSLDRHWSGLKLFVDYPEVPMDNNYGERQLRNPVVGRKNYYGSGSFWSAALTVMAFSLFQTLQIWNINPRIWLTAYLEACAGNGCRPPPDAECFLPWNMDQERLCLFTNPKPATNDTS